MLGVHDDVTRQTTLMSVEVTPTASSAVAAVVVIGAGDRERGETRSVIADEPLLVGSAEREAPVGRGFATAVTTSAIALAATLPTPAHRRRENRAAQASVLTTPTAAKRMAWLRTPGPKRRVARPSELDWGRSCSTTAGRRGSDGRMRRRSETPITAIRPWRRGPCRGSSAGS